jgi:type IV pilus assembly protein PilM
VIVAGVNSRRNRIASKAVVELPTLARRPSRNGATVFSKGSECYETARPAVRQLLLQVGFKGSEIAVVVPDETARIAFLTAENPSTNPEEQRTFIRWKLKKSVPFDVDTAQVAYRVLGPHRGGSGVDIMVALSPRAAVQGYETLFDSFDIHAGMILPSTLAALNLFTAPVGDTLFVKVTPECITTTVFQERRIQFYRRVTDVSLYDAIYPTVLYYQDKLGGNALSGIYVCGYDTALTASFDEIQEKLRLPVQRVGPKALDDIFKPAFGAIHLKPEGLL